MIYLIASIVFASSLLIFFKLFEKYHIAAPQAISVNYITAAFLGLFFVDSDVRISSGDTEWIVVALLLGTMFAIVFNLSRYTTDKFGMGITSVAMKLGVVFPVWMGILFYQEHFSLINYIGLFLGFIAILLVNYSPQKSGQKQTHRMLLFMPILVWIGSGVCDSSVQLANKRFPIPSANGSFSFLAFWSAGAVSLAYLIWMRKSWSWKIVLAGISLGIPNYFSIYFLLKCLTVMQNSYHLSSAMVFMMNNLSIVIVSIMIGIALFRERLSTINYAGVLVALLSLILVSFSY